MEKEETNNKENNYYKLEVLVKRIAKKIILLKNEGTIYKDYNKKTEEIGNDKKRGLEDFNIIFNSIFLPI